MIKDYRINPSPDFIHRKKIEEEIKNNDGYCISANNHSEENKCICESFKNQQRTGWCKCGQYYKVLHAPKVCLCGSARFKEQFLKAAKELTLQGYNVLIPILFITEEIEELTPLEREYFNEIHKAKIADADLIYVINYQGYIGNTTREEINWAAQLGKKIKYLEED